MDVARGMDKMHSRHVIHLDLKSPNILLTAGGTAKIAVRTGAPPNLDYLALVMRKMKTILHGPAPCLCWP